MISHFYYFNFTVSIRFYIRIFILIIILMVTYKNLSLYLFSPFINCLNICHSKFPLGRLKLNSALVLSSVSWGMSWLLWLFANRTVLLFHSWNYSISCALPVLSYVSVEAFTEVKSFLHTGHSYYCIYSIWRLVVWLIWTRYLSEGGCGS